VDKPNDAHNHEQKKKYAGPDDPRLMVPSPRSGYLVVGTNMPAISFVFNFRHLELHAKPFLGSAHRRITGNRCNCKFPVPPGTDPTEQERWTPE